MELVMGLLLATAGREVRAVGQIEKDAPSLVAAREQLGHRRREPRQETRLQQHMLRLRVGAFEDFAGEVIEDGLRTLLAWTARRFCVSGLEQQDEAGSPSLGLAVQARDLRPRATSLRSQARDA